MFAPSAAPNAASSLGRAEKATTGASELLADQANRFSSTNRGVAVMDAKEIMLDYGDYFTILLTGTSGIFGNNLPLSS